MILSVTATLSAATAVSGSTPLLTGTLYFGRNSGVTKLELSSGEYRHTPLDRRIFNPTHLEDGNLFLAELYPERIARVDLRERKVEDLGPGRQPLYLPSVGRLVYIARNEHGVEQLLARPLAESGKPVVLSKGPYEGYVPMVRVGESAVAFPAALTGGVLSSLTVHDFANQSQRIFKYDCLPFGWRSKSKEILCGLAHGGISWISLESEKRTEATRPEQRFTPLLYLEEFDVLLYSAPSFKFSMPENKALRAYRFLDEKSWTVLGSAPSWAGSMCWVEKQ